LTMAKSRIKNENKKGEYENQVIVLKNQLARALADYDNLRKRNESEREVLEKYAVAKVVLRQLPVLDMLVSAQNHLKDSGLEIIIGEFKKALNDLGVSEIEIKPGDEFNPHWEEAIEIVEGSANDKIAEVVESGWKIADEEFIIRPAKVKVTKIKI